MFLTRAKCAENPVSVNRLDVGEPTSTIPYTAHRIHRLLINKVRPYTNSLARAFMIRRKISVRGTIIVDSKGRANFVPLEPLTFWAFYDVLAALAVSIGILIAVVP